jgi:sugar O-acyltransferase (sialic acid O-acetyltransferase NeuD family)
MGATQQNKIMKKIIVVGASGHSAEIDDYFNMEKQFGFTPTKEIIGFIDDSESSYASYKFSAPFLGSIKSHQVRSDCFYIMGIANVKYRRPIAEKLVAEGASFTSYIHPTATISPSAVIGEGVVIALHVNIGPNVVVGDFTLLNSRCSLGHDTKVGKYNFISPNVCFSGFSSIGDENLFGINSATIPGIAVGDRNKIMAGMTLDKNVGHDETVFYRFKEKVVAFPK